MEQILKCRQCDKSFTGQYEIYCSKECQNIVQAQIDAWTYSGAWLKDLSALTNSIAAQQKAQSL